MNEFKQELNRLLLVKNLLIKEGIFHGYELQQYADAWNKAFNFIIE